MSRLASIRLTSTESDSTSLSGCPYSSTSQEYVDSDITMSPLSPKSPMSSRGSRPASPLASPVRGRGGNLAYLASRRSSRDSEAGDVAPLNCARYKHRRPSNFLELPTPDHFRPRVSSLPEKPYNPRDAEEIYRLRSFSITSKGIINRGDSIISKRSRSNTSVCSTTSRNSNVEWGRSPFEGSCCGSSYVSSESSLEVAKYRVVLLGESGVGKSSLVNQFMTSEYINTYDASLDDEFGEKSVSVLLDGEESEVIFIDHPAHEMSVENCLSTYDPHACIIVYSITDKGSFKKAEDIITYLWREIYTKEKAVILVGNKVDLARSRLVNTTEGKSLARNHDCKFIETSSGIQHNVDELLVGVVKQVRLRLAAQRKRLKRVSTSKTSLSLHAAKDLLNKMCLMDNKSKSCENLHVL
ncbi:LOW QUALITY PROTEIN: GTP-binding protein GEM-like [Portunus trituberculatus]|uniref:LOW QUALITY PROTEIN: GTP-binding protein GEM-like n=1 Tax=Portunus trituberculatus TaxID=210409 RepID=UPI001E1CC7F4|nr:LOW QUALITY PROTEIN: GTP-binding protein GEM-like [Portunus trituberculatus]